jgi:hypothetical protein
MLTRGGQQDIKEVAEANTMSIEPTISNNTHWSTKVRYTMSVDVTRQIMSRLKMAKTSVVRYHRSLPSRVRNACRRSVHALLDPKTGPVPAILHKDDAGEHGVEQDAKEDGGCSVRQTNFCKSKAEARLPSWTSRRQRARLCTAERREEPPYMSPLRRERAPRNSNR